MRPRKKNRHLPPCVYEKHGAFYLVKSGKWTRLGDDLGAALAEYARLTATTKGSMGKLLEETIEVAAERVKPNTIKQYRTASAKLSEIFVQFEPHQVTTRHVAQMMDALRNTPNMANRMRSVLKLAFDRAVLKGLCDSNPVIGAPRLDEKRRTRYLTDAEYKAIHGAGSPTLRAIIDLCYTTGQRISDVLAIRLSDITEDGILFTPQKTEELGKKLLIKMTPSLDAAIKQAKGLHKKTTPIYLLGQRNGKIRSYRGVRDLWERTCIKARVDDANLHDIRAKALTDAKRAGLDAQALGNHSTEAMTMRYIRGRETAVVEGPSFRHLIDNDKK